MMKMRTDGGGFATKAEIKVSFGKQSTWATRLSQIAKSKGDIIICTYSLPKFDYLARILDKRSDITIICHEKFKHKAAEIKQAYPDVNIILKPDIHAKIALIEPETTILSSANFGSSGWYEHTVIIKSKYVYSSYKDNLYYYINKK